MPATNLRVNRECCTYVILGIGLGSAWEAPGIDAREILPGPSPFPYIRTGLVMARDRVQVDICLENQA
jgi:hypothetical protein